MFGPKTAFYGLVYNYDMSNRGILIGILSIVLIFWSDLAALIRG